MFWDCASLEMDVPEKWDKKYHSKYNLSFLPLNLDRPLLVGENLVSLIFTISPPIFQTKNRISDETIILKIISGQKSGVIRMCANKFSNFISGGRNSKRFFWIILDFGV